MENIQKKINLRPNTKFGDEILVRDFPLPFVHRYYVGEANGYCIASTQKEINNNSDIFLYEYAKNVEEPVDWETMEMGDKFYIRDNNCPNLPTVDLYYLVAQTDDVIVFTNVNELLEGIMCFTNNKKSDRYEYFKA